jgi:hypothetical protein
MEDLDLNIHNYELNDLLNLFKIPFQFGENELKEAKKMVLKTHPDKSGLAKEYFLFFSQAYKYLLKIHQLRQSSTTTNTEYQKDDMWANEHSVLIDGKIKSMSQEEYSSWFNETFEKMKLKDSDAENGYGDWLKSDEDLNTSTAQNSSQMNEYIQNKKNQIRSLVVHNEFGEMSRGNHYDLLRDTPDSYGSGMFDKLQFEDLKKAHVESVIPVTEEDFNNRKKYGNIDELNRERTQDIAVKGKEWFSSHENKLKSMKSNDEDINIQRAYKLMNQDEQIRHNYEKFWSDLKRIKN